MLPLGSAVLGLCTIKLLDPHLVTRAQFLHFLRPLGPWLPWAFLLLLLVRPITLLPGQLLTAVGGILFGGWMGTWLAILGSLLGSTLTFALSRKLGAGFVRRRAGTRAHALEQAARHNDFLFALLFTLNPLVPTDPIIAVAASAGARYARTMAGTLLAIVPGTVATAYFGSALDGGHPLLVGLAVAGWAVSAVGGLLVGYRVYAEVLHAASAQNVSINRSC